jgi:hypothetical protein
MSTVKAKNHQVGSDGTASNNFTIYQPAVADGTSRWAVGVAGATTKDMVTVSGTNITLGGNLVQAATAAPAFSAYANATQNISIGTWTKVLFQTEEFDTNNNFASSTFTPTVAGYYQINTTIAFSANSSSGEAIALYKNGTINKIGTYALNGNVGNRISSNFLIYCNGSTDYIDIYVINNTAANPLVIQASGATDTYVQGFLARSA